MKEALVFFQDSEVIALDLEVEVFVDGHFRSHRLLSQPKMFTHARQSNLLLGSTYLQIWWLKQVARFPNSKEPNAGHRSA